MLHIIDDDDDDDYWNFWETFWIENITIKLHYAYFTSLNKDILREIETNGGLLFVVHLLFCCFV